MRAILRVAPIHLLILAIPAAAIAYNALASPPGPLSQWLNFANWFVLRAVILLFFIAVLQVWLRRGKPFDERANERLYTTLLLGLDLAIVSNALVDAQDLPALGLLICAAWAAWLVIWSIPRFRRTQLVSSFEVRCSPEVVFVFISDSRNLPRWRNECESVEMLTPEPIGPGSRFRQHGRLSDGKEFVGIEQIVDYLPDRRLTSRIESTLNYNLDQISFEPVVAGTRVTEENEIEHSFGGAAIGAMLRRGNRARVMAMRKAGEIRIKQILESEEVERPAG
jgi:hypothetical protein